MRMKTIFACFVSTLALNAHAGRLDDLLLPSLSKAQKEWIVAAQPDASTDLQVVSHGYKMIETYREREVKGPYGNKREAYDAVRWGWRVTVTNRGRGLCSVSVTYTLQDGDGFQLAVATEKKWLYAGETATFQGTATMPYSSLKRLKQGHANANIVLDDYPPGSTPFVEARDDYPPGSTPFVE